MWRLSGLFCVLILLAGCGPLVSMALHSTRQPPMETRFNIRHAAFVHATGTATIDGRVEMQMPKYVRGRYDNRLVAGKFARVRLIPVSDYSREHMWHLFQGEKNYTKAVQVADLDPAYERMMRFATADIDGRFVLHAVPAGTYFLYATSSRSDPPYAVADAVTVDDGDTVSVALNGE